jgi:hypothetical protein
VIRIGRADSIRQVSTGATTVRWKPVATIPAWTSIRNGHDALIRTGK